MSNEIVKKVYFVEATQKIDGFYMEVETLYIEESRAKALAKYEEVAKNEQKSCGVVVNEYEIKAQPNFFKKLLQQFKTLPDTIYRKMTIVNFQPVVEFCA